MLTFFGLRNKISWLFWAIGPHLKLVAFFGQIGRITETNYIGFDRLYIKYFWDDKATPLIDRHLSFSVQAAVRQFSQGPYFELKLPPPCCSAYSQITVRAHLPQVLAISKSDMGCGNLRRDLLSFDCTLTERSPSSSLSIHQNNSQFVKTIKMIPECMIFWIIEWLTRQHYGYNTICIELQAVTCMLNRYKPTFIMQKFWLQDLKDILLQLFPPLLG